MKKTQENKASSLAQFSNDDVEIIDQQTVYRGYFRMQRYILKHRLFGGGWSQPLTREVFERRQAAAALLYDPVLHKIVLIEQFRIGAWKKSTSPWLLELVAGIIEPNETSQDLILREIKEEAGLTPSALIPIFEYWTSPGATTEKIMLFCAKVDATKAPKIGGLEEEGEDIRIRVFEVTEVYELVKQGIICNAATILAIQWFQLNESYVRKLWE